MYRRQAACLLGPLSGVVTGLKRFQEDDCQFYKVGAVAIFKIWF
ncbi:hypothetical protein HMPREF9080_00297 [Cardiobacterium valvarum F0432]|uniref:Uncharacterized protein n=1 Tax=Cardiobacterium valvarum F0432 TaxID=797473 RepID=G9ZC20_9GAMM|nr:hypothetical protein HMPREF9080_00297 [Cardiobacterium valvarum F0432]